MAPSHRVTVGARAIVIPAFIASGDIIIRLGVGVVTGLLGTGDQGEGFPDLLKGLGAVDLEKGNTSKERRKGKYYRALMAMGSSPDPDGGGPFRMLRRADQSVEPALEERKSNIRQMEVTGYRIQDTEYRIQNTGYRIRTV